MKLLTIEIPISDDMAKKYMSLSIERRASYIDGMIKSGRFKIENYTTELEGEFPEEEDK
jgi:hypothetical protein